MEAYLEALDVGVLRAASQGFPKSKDPTNLQGDEINYEKWNAKARNTLFRGLWKDVFNRVRNHKDAHALPRCLSDSSSDDEIDDANLALMVRRTTKMLKKLNKNGVKFDSKKKKFFTSNRRKPISEMDCYNCENLVI